MERIDHINVHKIGRCRLVRQIHRMFQRKVPDRERFEFCVAGNSSPLVFVVQLRQTRGELSAARAGCGDNDERSGRFYEFVFTISFVADDGADVSRVSGYTVMKVMPHSYVIEALYEPFGGLLAHILCDDDGAYKYSHLTYQFDEP